MEVPGERMSAQELEIAVDLYGAAAFLCGAYRAGTEGFLGQVAVAEAVPVAAQDDRACIRSFPSDNRSLSSTSAARQP